LGSLFAQGTKAQQDILEGEALNNAQRPSWHETSPNLLKGEKSARKQSVKKEKERGKAPLKR
jgi:hypothetical protein